MKRHALAGLALVFLAAGCARELSPPNGKQMKITISRDTTRLVEPLNAEGYLDYLAAMNDALGQGVTARANAMVPIMQALGPAEVPEEHRARYFAALGIPPLEPKGEYLVSWYDYVRDSRATGRKLDSYHDQLEAAIQGPWSQRERPELAAWLEANRVPLDRLVEASSRPRCYAPRVAGDAFAVAAAWSLPRSTHEAARALIARAMLNLGQEKSDLAWAELMACRRLARLLGQGPTMFEKVVAGGLDRMAALATAAVAHYATPTSERATDRLSQLRELPPLSAMADALDTAERFLYLDAVATLSRADSRLLGAAPREIRSAMAPWIGASADWDEALRIGNAWYDRMVAIAREPASANRLAAARALERDLENEVREGRSWGNRLKSLVVESRRTRAAKAMARALMPVCFPAESMLLIAEQQDAAVARQAQVALALAAYRAEHGQYPDKLSQLNAAAFADKTLPADPFSGQALRYQRQGRGYRLWSVGPNGSDDSARSGHGADDVTLQMPPPLSRAKT